MKKINTNELYFKKDLEDKIKEILNYPITIIEAPTGYGKTTVIKYFMKMYSDNPNVECLSIVLEEPDLEKLWIYFCDVIQKVDKEAGDYLLKYGVPTDKKKMEDEILVLSKIKLNLDVVIIFDNYYDLKLGVMNDFLIKCTNMLNDKFHFVVIEQTISLAWVYDLVLKKYVNYIKRQDFEFTKDDIKNYYSKCGLELADNLIEQIYKYSEGWISSIYLLMINYIENGELLLGKDIYYLIENTIWNKISSEVQDFLLKISLFDSFSLKQAYFIYNNDKYNSDLKLEIDQNPFIKFQSKKERYYIHTNLKYYIREKFELKDKEYRYNAISRAAIWRVKQGEYLEAIKLYYSIDDFEGIFSVKCTVSVLVGQVKRQDLDLLLEIVNRCPIEIKCKYPRFLIISSFILYTNYFTKSNFELYYEAENIVKNLKDISEDEKRKLLGDTIFLSAFMEFNSVVKMNDKFDKAYKLLNGKSSVADASGVWCFGTPSMLYLFHSKIGNLNQELEEFRICMDNFQKLTNNQAIGGDILFEAEKYYYEGKFKEAEICAYKAICVAEKDKQYFIQIAAIVTLAKIASCYGDLELIEKYMKEIDDIASINHHVDILLEADLAKAVIYSFLGQLENIPDWIKKMDIEKRRIPFATMPFINYIFARCMYQKGEYTKVLGYGAKYLDDAKKTNNLMVMACLYISMSLAHLKMGFEDKAKEYLIKSLDIFMPDNLIMTYIIHFEELRGLLEDEEISKIKGIDKIISTYNNIGKGVLKSLRGRNYKEEDEIRKKYGLTKREFEVAELASKRLSNKEIGEKLFITENTVKYNMKIIFQKMYIKSRFELSKFFEDYQTE